MTTKNDIDTEFIIRELEKRQMRREEQARSSGRLRMYTAILITTIIGYLIIGVMDRFTSHQKGSNHPMQNRSDTTHIKHTN